MPLQIKPRQDKEVQSFLGGELYYNSKIPEQQQQSFKELITKHYLPKLEQVLHKDEPDILKDALIDELFGKLSAFKLSHYQSDEFEAGHKQNYFGSVAGSVDFVLKKDENVACILEAKKPKSSEMISAHNANTTAFHECVLYYLREKERAKELHKRFEVKYIIITDFYEFFFFDEAEFEKYFYQNDYIKGFYERYKSLIKNDLDQESQKRNKDFYAELKQYFGSENFSAELSPLLLNLQHLKDDKCNIKPFFKAFAPEFLLDKYIHKSEINEAFYKELLYILGLEVEKTKDNKETNKIIPSNVSGTVYENIYENIPHQEDKTQENIISLIIVWLNRILFLKLIEANLIRFSPTTQGKEARKANARFLNTKNIQDFQTLENLFFKVFAKPHDERDEASPFFHLPYLNSSLFNPSQIEHKLIRIQTLSNDKELLPYKEYNKKQKHQVQTKIPLLRYLLDFLDRYDFGSGEEYEADTLINASVLGNVFERINAYKDGSFYTPSAITSYMCEENLEQVILRKFNEANPQWQCKNIADIESEITREMRQSSDRESIKQKYKDFLKTTLICDPAVGSGHFLVSVLNQMIKIHYDLGLLSNEILRNKLQIIGDELYLSDFSYTKPKSETEPSHKIQKELFVLKKSIIENNLFGVDINPNSVEICKLRLWIELLKNSYYLLPNDKGYTKNLDSSIHQMQTLPNIDINIKCGNSLISNIELHISKDKLEAQLKSLLSKDNATLLSGGEGHKINALEIQTILNDLKVKLPREIEKYKKATNAYKDEKDDDLRASLKSEINSAKGFILNLFVKTHPTYREFKSIFASYLKTYGYSGVDNAKVPNANKKELQEWIEKLNDYLFKAFEFHKTLDIPKQDDPRGFAEKDFIALVESMKSYETIKTQAREYFEWRFEFPEVLDANGDFMGFDLIIGNPPYGNLLSKEQKDFCKKQKRYLYADTGDTYKLFIEKGFNLLAQNRNLGYIVPLSATSSDSNIALHKMLLENCEFIKVSSYGHRPVKIFPHAEQRTSIISCTKTFSKTKNLMTTKINRRYSNQSIKNVMKGMSFVNSLDFVQDGAFCKIGLPIEKDIMQKVYAQKQTLKNLMGGKQKLYYRTTGGGYYDIYTSYSTKSSKENSFNVLNSKLVVALMSSTLFYWFRNAYSNNRDSYIYEFRRFPIPKFSNEQIKLLEKLGSKYEKDIEKNHDYSNGVKTYKIRKSKHIIDEIDRLICPLYGLSAEEMEFIINYELEFRTDSKD